MGILLISIYYYTHTQIVNTSCWLLTIIYLYAQRNEHSGVFNLLMCMRMFTLITYLLLSTNADTVPISDEWRCVLAIHMCVQSTDAYTYRRMTECTWQAMLHRSISLHRPVRSDRVCVYVCMTARSSIKCITMNLCEQIFLKHCNKNDISINVWRTFDSWLASLRQRQPGICFINRFLQKSTHRIFLHVFKCKTV